LANYAADFAQTLETHVNDPNAAGQSPIIVRRFQWTGENNHQGRADAALRLLADLSQLELPAGDRVILWGHSHAGNVFALLTHLLGSSLEIRQRFWEAIDPIYRRPFAHRVRDPRIELARTVLLAEDGLALRPDLVTFGTPVRYGWESSGYRSLLHVVHHVPASDAEPYRAEFPPSLERLRNGRLGDFLQQFGIAGTNFPVNPCSVLHWATEFRLHRLLQLGVRRRDLWQRWMRGIRVPEEGTTRLVNYYEGEPWEAQLFLGHGIYTLKHWLPFHLECQLEHLRNAASADRHLAST
ncbi:MAG TPA: hypothetical protein VIY86_07895, partial [Pirellulaceae bacterium]